MSRTFSRCFAGDEVRPEIILVIQMYLKASDRIWMYPFVFEGIWRYPEVSEGNQRYLEVFEGIWMYLKYLQGSQQSYREKVMKAWEIEDQLFLTDWNWLDLGKVAAKGKLKKINSNKKRIDATRRQLQWERRSKGILVPSQTFFSLLRSFLPLAKKMIGRKRTFLPSYCWKFKRQTLKEYIE